MTAPLAETAGALPRRSAWLGWTLALLATLAFSLAPAVGKAAIDLGIDALLLLTLRLLITTGLLGATLGFSQPARLRIRPRSLRMCAAAGFANGLGMVFFFLALTRLEAAIGAMILSLSPLVVLLLLALRGERFTHRNTIRLGLGLAGVYLLIGPSGQVDLGGALLAMAAVLAFPIQLVVIQWHLRDEDPRTVTLYIAATMALVAGGWWLALGAAWTPLGLHGWLLLGVLAVVSTYLARLAMFVAIREMGSGQFGLLQPLETMLTVMWSVLFLGERLAWVQWLASALIAASALMAMQRLRRVRWLRE